MTAFLVSVASFLVAIGILVAVHEYGHYLVARLVGVKVLRFSIGFGRPLWIRRAGPDRTEYCVSAIPFGGYVKLLDERDCPVALAEQHRAFNRQSIPARVAILAAGPLLNFLFAIVAYWCMYMIGVPGTRPIIGEVSPDSIASRAGLESRDEIIGVGGRRIATWDGAIVAVLDELLDDGRIVLEVVNESGSARTLTLDAAGREGALTEPGQLFVGLGLEPWAPELPPVIGEVLAGGAAERAGLASGDEVVEADRESVHSWPQWVEFVRRHPGETVTVAIRRGGQNLEVSLDIERVTADDGLAIGRIGAGPSVPESFYEQRWEATERYGPLEAVQRAVQRSWDMASLTVRMVARMITGDVSLRNISGPINIAQYAGYSASVGSSAFLNFLAVVSISLGILNLVPVPMLDGGQIAYQLAEAAKGSPLSERAQMIGQQVGLFFLLLLMSFAFYNDLSRLFG
jgi:regulator of sigma E protease